MVELVIWVKFTWQSKYINGTWNTEYKVEIWSGRNEVWTLILTLSSQELLISYQTHFGADRSGLVVGQKLIFARHLDGNLVVVSLCESVNLSRAWIDTAPHQVSFRRRSQLAAAQRVWIRLPRWFSVNLPALHNLPSAGVTTHFLSNSTQLILGSVSRFGEVTSSPLTCSIFPGLTATAKLSRRR